MLRKYRAGQRPSDPLARARTCIACDARDMPLLCDLFVAINNGQVNETRNRIIK
jgi:hypothetical protein